MKNYTTIIMNAKNANAASRKLAELIISDHISPAEALYLARKIEARWPDQGKAEKVTFSNGSVVSDLI